MRSKIVLSFSFLLALSALCFCAGPYAQLKQQYDAAVTDDDRKQVLQHFQGSADPELREELRYALSRDARFAQDRNAITRMINLRAKAEELATINSARVESKAKEIKASPLYRDTGNVTESNWIGRAFARLGEWLSNLLDNWFKQRPSRNAPTLNAPNVSARVLLWIIGGLLASLIVVFLIFVVRHVNWTHARRRKATALLDEDEPDRNVDEWLSLAEALANQGRYREAVRCLYLAILLRFDEANVARFIRSETNWEHLGRIQASPNRPAEVDFLAPTQAFDRIWYGQRVRGIEDVDQFRIWYGQASKSLMGTRP